MEIRIPLLTTSVRSLAKLHLHKTSQLWLDLDNSSARTPPKLQNEKHREGMNPRKQLKHETGRLQSARHAASHHEKKQSMHANACEMAKQLCDSTWTACASTDSLPPW